MYCSITYGLQLNIRYMYLECYLHFKLSIKILLSFRFVISFLIYFYDLR